MLKPPTTLILALSLQLNFIGSIYSQDESLNQKPNIIFLLTDDQSTITMGCYGNSEVKTPNLDQLATDGVIFDRHYVTTAICMASRANIFTGLYEFRTGCNFTTGNLTRELWETSYPMRFKKAGYRTAFAGKFGITIEGEKQLPSQDFDLWGGGPGQTNYMTARNSSMKKYANEFPHSTLSYAAFSKDFINQSVADKVPFCLSISFKASHRPVQPDPQFDSVYKNTIFPKPKNYGRENGLHLAEQSKTGRQYTRFEEWGYSNDYQQVMRKYNQQIFGVDVAVGEIRKALKQQGITNNTVIIFTSDNGFLCGSHGYGSKVIPYEESTRVPLIIFDPRHPNSGKGLRCDSLTGSIDLSPTMLQLAGLEAPENIDGVSLAPLLQSPTKPVRESLSLMNFWGPKTAHSFGVVTNSWKYLYWYSQEDDMLATEELFDMNLDADELANAAFDDSNLDALNKMRKLYDQHLYEINEKAIRPVYREYKDLFDRKQTWTDKKEILKNSKLK
ncbi:MAG: sulfatase family protein [Mariniblastus sp.]